MIELIESHSPENIEGVYTVSLHKDSRITLPIAWREILPNTSELMLLYDGKKGIVVPTVVGLPSQNIIVHRVIIQDERFRLPRQYYKSHGITQPQKVWLIGKGNHFEIVFSESVYEETLKKSQELVLGFQQKLLKAKGEI